MVDVLEFRIGKLTQMSVHYRQLASDLFPEMVSNEIALIADQFDDEVARMNRDCRGRRTCPCEFRPACVELSVGGSVVETQQPRKAA